MTYTLLRRALFFFTLIVLFVARSYAQSYPNIAIETNPYDQHETAIAGHLTNANKPNRYSGFDPHARFTNKESRGHYTIMDRVRRVEHLELVSTYDKHGT